MKTKWRRFLEWENKQTGEIGTTIVFSPSEHGQFERNFPERKIYHTETWASVQ